MFTIPRLREDFNASCAEVGRVIDAGCDQRTIRAAIDTRESVLARLESALLEMGEDYS
jgi:hypothetical protein